MRAYILVKSREAENIVKHVRGMENVRFADLVYGGYDAVIVVEFEGLERLGRFVMEEIRNRFKVEETMTLIVV